MKYLPLILAGLWRKPARTIFTALSIVVAFILFGILSGLDSGLAHLMENARLDRMYVTPRFGAPMPISDVEKIAAIPGVSVVAPSSGMSGYYRDRKNTTSVTMTEASYFAARPEVGVTRQQIDQMARIKTGALVSMSLAKQFGWKVGDKVPLATNEARQNGSKIWTFDIVGIFDDSNRGGGENNIIANYKYFDDARVNYKGTANYFIIRIKDPARAAQIGYAIDDLFANSPAPSRTMSEKSAAVSSLARFGDIGFLTHGVVSAVLFALLFLTGNTMMQSVRERIPEFAVLKTLGFSDKGLLVLVFCESVFLCILAGAAGLAIVKLGLPLVKNAGAGVSALLLLPWQALATGFGCALLVAFVSAVFPALRVKRLKVVDALAGR